MFSPCGLDTTKSLNITVSQEGSQELIRIQEQNPIFHILMNFLCPQNVYILILNTERMNEQK